MASREGHKEIVSLLLNKGAKIHKKDEVNDNVNENKKSQYHMES